MEIKLKQNIISGYKQLDSSEAYCAVSADIVVPDTQEDISRILSVSPAYRIKSKDIEEGALLICGEADVTVAYVPEEDGPIRSLHSTIPFEKRFEVSALHGGCVSCADIAVTAVDARMLNPRKVLVSVEVKIAQKSYELCELAWYSEPEEKPGGVFMRSKPRRLRYISTAAEKTFSLEEEYAIGSESGKLLAYEVKYLDDSADRVGNKMVVKGHAEVSAFYLTDSMSPESLRFSVPFSQLFDIPDGDGIPDHEMSILSTGEYFELADGKLYCEMHAVAQLVCAEEREICCVDDMYACRQELSVTRSELANIHCTVSDYRDDLRCTAETDRPIEKVVYTSARCGKPSASAVPVSTEVVYRSGGELFSCRIREELKADELPEKLFLENTAVPNGKNIDVRIGVMGAVRRSESESFEQISSAELSETQIGRGGASLYMARASENDLWGMAKKYGSDPELIQQINQLENSDITGKMLLIPRI